MLRTYSRDLYLHRHHARSVTMMVEALQRNTALQNLVLIFESIQQHFFYNIFFNLFQIKNKIELNWYFLFLLTFYFGYII